MVAEDKAIALLSLGPGLLGEVEHWEWQGGLGWLHPVGTSFRVFTFREHGTPSQGPRSATPGKTRGKADSEGAGDS